MAMRELSGRWIVAGMFGFALLLIGLMWLYWRLHLGPFLPLQRAIAAEFEGSQPLVEGGQRKMHEETPSVLRITMKVDFDPIADDEKATALADRIEAFVRERTDAAPYETLELHLFWPEPEKEIRQRTMERRM